MLTKRQKQVLDYVKAYQHEHGGVSPTIREIAAALGGSSKSSVYNMLTGLEERGYIARLPNRARAIEVMPAQQTARMRKLAVGCRCVSLPVMGYID